MPDAISEPMACYCLDLLWNRGDEVGDATNPRTGEKIEFKDVTKMLATLSGGSLSDAFVELSGLRFVDLINITWAMAKAADEDIPDPKTWVREFGTFPVDVIVPEVLGLALEGMASAKNLKRLQSAVKKIRTNLEPSSSTTSSSQDSKED